MLQNSTPVYFIDWCLFTALGMEEYIGGLQFISATDTFDGLHPQVWVPSSFDYDHSLTSEQTLNALLSNQEVRDFIRTKGGGKLLLWMFDEETERLARELGLEICMPPASLRRHWDHKANTNRLAEKANVPCVPYVLSTVDNYAQLRYISAHLGEHLVVQTPHGMSGMTTFFISSESDFEKHRSDITNGEEMKIMKRINCRSAGLEACITRHGVAVAPMIGELVGVPELTLYKGGWCGNEFYPHAFPEHIRRQSREYTIKLGEQLRQVGYRGYFEPDFLIDLDDGTLYLGELNLRFSGFTPLINNTNIAREDIPLLLLHLAEWMDFEVELDIAALNERWSRQENLAPLSFLHFKNVEENLVKPVPTGVYRMEADGSVIYLRHALHPQVLEREDEAFWFSTAGRYSNIGIGDEYGGLFIRSRVTEDGRNLTPFAKAWVNGMKRFSEMPEPVAG